MQRREEADARKATEATEVFERSVPGPNGEAPPEVLTVDFLRKYIRFCRRLTPVMTEEAQAMVSDKYVDMRTRFQTGMVDGESNKKPRLAVTTRTLEALIRLSTAHAKLKLRKDEVLPEDVHEAYALMMAAREEEVPAPQPPIGGDAPGPDLGGNDMGPGDTKRGKKRTRRQAAGIEDEAISSVRVTALISLVGRVFARQQTQVMARGDLLEGINAGLSEGERPFEEEEFAAGLTVMESRNKVFVSPEAGEVILVG